MTKAAALYQFWTQFLTAYDENSVPTGDDSDDSPEFPYCTYQVVTDSFGGEVALSASLWYRSTSWTAANAKAEEVSQKLGRSGIILPCDGGAVWLKRGQPFSQSMGDESDDLIKRKYLNVTAEFLTAD